MTTSIGLYNDDLHDYYDNVNLEAIRRLPPDEYDQYVYRVIRASQLEMTKSYIPPSERATYEEVSVLVIDTDWALIAH